MSACSENLHDGSPVVIERGMAAVDAGSFDADSSSIMVEVSERGHVKPREDSIYNSNLAILIDGTIEATGSKCFPKSQN